MKIIKNNWKQELIYKGQNDPVWWITTVLGNKLWSKQRDICNALIEHERVAVPASFGVGKCVAFGEKITLTNGLQIPVEELVDQSFEILAWDQKTGEQVPVQASAFYNGKKSVYKLTTRSGRSVIRTTNHPFYGCELTVKYSRFQPQKIKWYPLTELTKDHAIAVPYQLNVEGDIEETFGFCKYFGYLLGSLEIKRLTNRFNKPACAEFNSLISHSFSEKQSQELKNLIDLKKSFSLNKIPEYLFSLSNDSLKVILNRLFTAGGKLEWVDSEQQSSSISFSSLYEGFIHDLNLLMLRFGIRGTVYSTLQTVSGKNVNLWQWQCNKASELLKFIDKIGVFGEDQLLTRCKEQALHVYDYQHLLDQWQHLELPEGYFWDGVKSIEACGEVDTVGISVPNYNTYLTSVVEHNTFLAARIALWFLNNHRPSKVLTTAPCFDDKTEILTENGWKLFKDLLKNEKVASLENGQLRFVQPTDWIEHPFSGDLIGYKEDSVDFLVTPNHKLYVSHDEQRFNLIPAEEVYGQSCYFSKNVDWFPLENKSIHSTWFLLIGYLYGRWDYFIPLSKNKFVIQVKEQDVAVVKSWFKALNIEFKYNELEKTFTFITDQLDSLILPNCYITNTITDQIKQASRVNLINFLKGFMTANGTLVHSCWESLINASMTSLFINDLQEVTLKAGFDLQVASCSFFEKGVLIKGWKVVFNVVTHVRAKQDGWYQQKYEGNVYCVTVPSGILLVRRNYKWHWSGNTARQVRDLLWKELRTAHQMSIVPLGGELLQLSLTINDNHFAAGFSTDETNMDKYTGLHSPNMLVIFDQAAGIPTPIWEGTEGLMTSAKRRWLAISNTAISDSEFANICIPQRKTRFGQWKIIPIKASESPNIRAGKNIYPGLVAYDWVQKRQEAWGTSDPLYRIFVEAEFVQTAQMVVLNYETVFNCFEIPGEMGDTIEIGVDVAREGLDSSVLFARSGSKSLEVRRFTGNDTMSISGETIVFKRDLEQRYNKPVTSIKIDMIGMGAGVYDRLIELNEPAIAVTNSQAAFIEPERYVNLRAELAFSFRSKCMANLVGIKDIITSELDSLRLLEQDLLSIKYKIASNGKIILWSKPEIKRELGRSPDFFDACVLAFETPGDVPSAEFINSEKETNIMTDDDWSAFLGYKVNAEDHTFKDIFVSPF